MSQAFNLEAEDTTPELGMLTAPEMPDASLLNLNVEGGNISPTSTADMTPVEMPTGYDSATTGAITRQSASLTPEGAAADMLLADKLGYPADMVSRNRSYFRDMDMANQVDEVLQGAPAVRGVYNQSPLTASLLRDDLNNAASLEKLMGGYTTQPDESTSTARKEALDTLVGGQSAEIRATRPDEWQPQNFWARLPKVVLEGSGAIGENGLNFLSGLLNTYTPTAQDIDQYLPGQGQEAVDNLKAGLAEQPMAGGLESYLKGYRQRTQAVALQRTGNVVQDFAEDVVRMGPQMAAQGLLYAAGGFVPSMLFMGTQIAGGQYAELTEDAAQDKARAFMAALTNAGLQAPLEALAAGKVLDIFKGTGLANVFRAGVSSMGTEFVTEWAQSYPDALTTLWAEAEHKGRSGGDTMRYFFDNIWQTTKQGMYEGLVASVYGGLGGAGKVGYEYGRYRAGKTDGDFFNALDESAATSKTRSRLPQEYQKVVEAATAGGPVENVYVSPQVMREAAGDDAAFFQLAAKVGLDQEAITRAEELGADLEIPLSLYQTHIAGTETSVAMRHGVKFRPEDMTLAERLKFEQEAPAQMADALKRLEADQATMAELDAALAPVQEQLATVYGKDATAANMNLLKARARIAADWWTESGEALTPAQVVTDKWGLTLEVVGQEAGLAGADLLHAMYRNKATTPQSFVDEVLAGTAQDKKSFIGMGTAVREDMGLAESEIVLASDQVRHIREEHPDFAEWERIPDVLRVGEVVRLGKNRVTGGYAYAFVLNEGDSSMVVLAGPSTAKKTGNRITVLTAFRDTPAGVRNWIEQKNTAIYQSAADDTASPSPLRNKPSGSGGMSETTIGAQANTVNVTPRGSISFTDSGAVIRLFKDSADLSTFVHEAAHLFMKDMRAMVDTGNAPLHIASDMQALEKFAYTGAEAAQTFYEKAFQPSHPSFAGRAFDSLSVTEIDQVLHVAQQEKLADAFLTYLREGKAPSPELRSAFRRFKDWHKGLYQSIMGTVEINDDVRGVFDRMLATNADMALVEALHAQEAANVEAVNSVARDMLTEAEAKRLGELQREAGAQSREAHLSASLRSYLDSLLGKKELATKAREEIDAMPVYAVMDLAVSEGGLSRDSVATEFGEATAKALSKKRPGLIRKAGGLNVHDLAMVSDFASAEDMILVMMEAAPKSKAVNAKVKEGLARREEQLRGELGALDAVPGEEAYYNDSRLAAMLLELRALERRAGNRTTSRAGTAGLSRQWARELLGTMPVRDALNVGKQAAAEARAAAESAKALAEGRHEDAAIAKRRQAINHAMVLESLDMRSQQDSIHKALRRWEKSKGMDFGCQEQIMALAQRYGVGGNIRKGQSRFAPTRPDELPPLASFMEALTEDDTFGMPPFSDFLLSENVPPRMSMEQMREVWDCMRWLAEQGSPGEAQLITEGVSGSIKDAAAEGAAVLQASGNVAPVHEEGTMTRTFFDKWRYLFSRLNEFKDMMMRADGFQEIGPEGSHLKGFHSQWFQRLSNAHSELSRIYKQEVMPEQKRIEMVRYGFIQRFNKTFTKHAANINGVQPPQNMKDIGRSSWTAEHIWCLARNMGNAGNLKTLHEGYGLSMPDLQALTSVLTTEEWQAVQAEGDLVGGFYDRTDAVFRKVYGRPMPDKVQPQELEVQTADGQTLTLPGWYFPIAVDGKLDPDVKDKQQTDLIQADPKFSAFGPSLARNHTKGRSGTGRPVGLYFDVFERALQDQLRFMTHAPALKDFDRITRNPEWRKAYVAAFGQDAYDVIRPKLKYLSRPYGESQGALEGWIARSRQLATLFILGHNVKTFVRQFQGFSPAQTEVGGGWIARGMGRVYRNPMAAVRAINDLSPFMADRQQGYDRELRQSLRGFKAKVQVKVRGKLYSEKDIQQFTMGLITIGDCMTVYPIWQGAYMKAQDKLGLGQKEAITYADSIVQKTNASASPIDLTPIQQADGVWRFFTMFMSESLRKGSRMRYWWGALQAGKIGMFRYAQHVAMESIVPALFFVGLVGLFSDDEPDKEDLALAVTTELIGPYPFLSSIPGALQYNKPLMQSPVFAGVEAAQKTVESGIGILKNPNDPQAWSRFYKSGIDVLAFSAGVGNARRIYETGAEGWEDLQLGQTHNPMRLFFRKPKK